MTRWSAHFAEAVAVTVGVLLAFAIQAWWEERKEEEDRHKLALVVAGELQQVESYLKSTMTMVDEHRHSLANGFNNLSIDSEMSAKEMSEELLPIGILLLSPMPRTAIDDLVGSGSFRLLENPEIRDKINAYRQQLDSVSDVFSFLRNIEMDFVNYAIKYGNLYAMQGSLTWQNPEISLEITNIPPDYSKLVANREMLNYLWARMSWSGVYKIELQKQLRLATDLKLTIKSDSH